MAVVAWMLTLVAAFNVFDSKGVVSLAHSKIVFIPMPVSNSQYFNMLSLAEEMARRDHLVCNLVYKILSFFCPV